MVKRTYQQLILKFPTRKNTTAIYILTIYLIPFFFLLWFVYSFSINVPYSDQWNLVGLFDKIASGSAKFKDFFVQHNEHRIIFPKIIFAILAFASNWNIRVEIYFSILFSIMSLFILHRISEVNQSEDRILLHLSNAVNGILIFSLSQHQNWLSGFQLSWFLVNFCFVTAVHILTVSNNFSNYLRILFAGLLCFIASFSLAHGLLSWVAIVPSIISLTGRTDQKKIIFLTWIILFCMSCLIYSIGYHEPAHPAGFDRLFFLNQPLLAAQYFLRVLGSPIGIFPEQIGLCLFLVFILFNIYAFTQKDSMLYKHIAPWLSIGWFVILFDLITTIGRAGLGINQSMSSRYVTVSILLIISCLQMWRLFIGYQKKWFSQIAHRLLAFGFFSIIIVAASVSKYDDAISDGRQDMLLRTNGATCLEIIHFLDKSLDNLPGNCLQHLYPSPLVVRSLAKLLEKIGFRDFPRDIAFVTRPDKPHGHIDLPPTKDQMLVLSSKSNLLMSGWAILPENIHRPQVVLFSYGKSRLFFASTIVQINRPDVATALNSNRYTTFGWKVEVPIKFAPIGETSIKAWIYKRESQQFVKLVGEPRITVVR